MWKLKIQCTKIRNYPKLTMEQIDSFPIKATNADFSLTCKVLEVRLWQPSQPSLGAWE